MPRQENIYDAELAKYKKMLDEAITAVMNIAEKSEESDHSKEEIIQDVLINLALKITDKEEVMSLIKALVQILPQDSQIKFAEWLDTNYGAGATQAS